MAIRIVADIIHLTTPSDLYIVWRRRVIWHTKRNEAGVTLALLENYAFAPAGGFREPKFLALRDILHGTDACFANLESSGGR